MYNKCNHIKYLAGLTLKIGFFLPPSEAVRLLRLQLPNRTAGQFMAAFYYDVSTLLKEHSISPGRRSEQHQ